MFKQMRSMLAGTNRKVSADDRSQWTNQQWMDHMIKESRSASERSEIYAIFSRS
jgi:hypothetical protein